MRMRAAVLTSPHPVSQRPLRITDVADPQLKAGYVLLRVRACGVCRTDLHIVEGELPLRSKKLIPGHQIVGEIVEGATPELPVGTRVGVSWIGGIDGKCWYCQHGLENLCDSPTFTGYSVNGGYAEYALARADFVFPLPATLDDLHAAPLLCAGIIGFRCLRLAAVGAGARLGLYGFGAAAHVAIQVARHWGIDVYAFTRDRIHQDLAAELGAVWAGFSTEEPPQKLDAAIIFAPAGELVPASLKVLKKGGAVILGGIHMSPIPSFEYNLLYHERLIRSVANNTRQDGIDFLKIAADIPIRTKVQVFPLEEANAALNALKHDAIRGAAVLRVAEKL
jgi:propanol-preferring alcohol dehydrogenase